MPRASSSRATIRFAAALMGIGLLMWLIARTGTATVVGHARAVGWGMVLILALGGLSHLVRTYAWRLTFRSDIRNLSAAKTFALRLISEAIGNFGLAGQVVGDTARISLLGPKIPIADRVSSVALDRGLYTLTAAVVGVIGVLASVALLPLPGAWQTAALVFALTLSVFVLLTVISFGRGWRILSGATRGVGHIPSASAWVARKLSVIESIEEHLLTFHSKEPGAFWSATILYCVSQLMAIAEVYLVLRFMGVRITLIGALVIEAFTKLISAVGAVNPGNVGTYEGGNLLLARMLHFAPAAGLTLALCRRARTLFWAGIGALCLVVLSRGKEPKMREPEQEIGADTVLQATSSGSAGANQKTRSSTPAVIVVVGSSEGVGGLIPALASVGALSVALRAILSAQALEPSRTVLSVPTTLSGVLKDALLRTRRLPQQLEWRERQSGAELCALIREVASTSDRILVVSGSNVYRPALFYAAVGEQETGDAVVFKTGTEAIGLCCISKATGLQLAEYGKIDSAEDLQSWIEAQCDAVIEPAPSQDWQRLITSEDFVTADRKMDSWLVKPTDGIYARFNRKISIPISRQLIKTPITPNGVTFVILAVSVAAAAFFARGGYWNMLAGALLSVWASILDGCDGEVARFKLKSSKFGCWLDTICDYLYYLMTFAGMAWGLKRSSGSNLYLMWGAVLVIGMVLSFVVVGWMRTRMPADRPEKLLASFQMEAEKRSSNPLLFLARNTEFIIRRCFFPYALLVAAVFNLMKPVFLITAVSANLVWTIALYSALAVSRKQRTPARIRTCVEPETSFSTPA